MSDDHAEHVAEQSRQYYTALQQQTQQSASVPAQEPGAAAGAPADDEAARRAQRAEQYYTQLYHRDVARLVDALYDRDVARLQLALSVTQAEVRHVWEVLRLACELGARRVPDGATRQVLGFCATHASKPSSSMWAPYRASSGCWGPASGSALMSRATWALCCASSCTRWREACRNRSTPLLRRRCP